MNRDKLVRSMIVGWIPYWIWELVDYKQLLSHTN